MRTASPSLLRRSGRLWVSRGCGEPQRTKIKTRFRSRFAASQLCYTELITPLYVRFFMKLL